MDREIDIDTMHRCCILYIYTHIIGRKIDDPYTYVHILYMLQLI